MADDFPYTRISKELVVNVREITNIGLAKAINKCVIADSFGGTGACIVLPKKLNDLIESGCLCVGKNIKITDCGKSLATHLNDAVQSQYRSEPGKQMLVVLKLIVMGNEQKRPSPQMSPAFLMPPPFKKFKTYATEEATIATTSKDSKETSGSDDDLFDVIAKDIKFDIPVAPRKCTPAEIAEKRRQALERLKNKK